MQANLVAGWIAVLAGIIAGAVIGLFFHRKDWLGGYAAYRRRMVRLGHIAFVGLGILNVLFGLTCRAEALAGAELETAAWMLVVAAAAMPTCCFLAAWKKVLRHLFPIPVLLVGGSIVLLLLVWSGG